MKTYEAYKLVSPCNGRLWSYNSVLNAGRPFASVEYSKYTVEYKQYIWARPKLRGSKLFALKNRIQAGLAGLCGAKLYQCRVTTPEVCNKMVTAPYTDDIPNLWIHKNEWYQTPLFEGTIIVGQLMLLEEVDFLT